MKCKLGLVIVCALALGCGKSSRGGGDGGGEEDGGGGDGGTSETTTCLLGGANRYAHGRWPAPESTFTLPANATLYYTNVQTSFPSVDWATLDRLYIPAGTYNVILLGNLPNRSADRPLVITNTGGKVYVGGTNGQVRVELLGGSNWVFTGRYDPVAGTGHEDFPGHWNANYAESRGRYGIEIRQHFVAHSGVKIADGATDFEVEYVEVWETGFAGFLVKTDREPDAVMRNVKLHDLYIHDTDAEGFYIGNTTYDPTLHHTFENLHIYNNRVLRTGAETLQLSHVGDGTEVCGNVFLASALDWRDPFQPLYQDGNLQLATRTGNVSIHHNVFVGSGGNIFTLRTFAGTSETPSGDDALLLEANYFSHARGASISYLHNVASNTATRVSIARNQFRAMTFAENILMPAVTAEDYLIRSEFMQNPLAFTDNVFEGSRFLLSSFDVPNGTEDNLTAAGNQNGTIAPVTFADSGFAADFDYQRLERWSDCSQHYENAPITYRVGDYVTHDGSLYRLDAALPSAYTCPANTEPQWNPSYWYPCGHFMEGEPPNTYAVGDVVDTEEDVHYELTTALPAPYMCATAGQLYANLMPREDPAHWTPVIVNANPAQAPAYWTEIGLPVDDVRLRASSAHAGVGLVDVAP